jgi:two-component system sensor histidine kinase and response regulator WspE
LKDFPNTMTSAATMEPIDPAMLDLFRAEVDTHVPVLSEGLLVLEKDPSQTKPLEGLMRAAHSIKGAARIIGLTPAVQLSHVLEDCMVAAQAKRIALGGDAIDVLLRGVDMLGRIAQGMTAEPPDGLSTLVAQIEAVANGSAPAKPAEAPPVVAAAPAPTPQAVPESSLIPAGALDAAAAEQLRQTWLQRFDRGDRCVRFDLSQAAEVEPAGLALLAAIARMAKQRDGLVLEIVHARPDVLTLLCLTGLDRVYRLNTDSEAGTCKANA